MSKVWPVQKLGPHPNPPPPMKETSMRRSLHHLAARVAAGVGALLLVAATSAFAQGSVTGRVVTAEGKTPLGDVQLLVEGTSIVTSTNADGRFTLRNVPV